MKLDVEFEEAAAKGVEHAAVLVLKDGEFDGEVRIEGFSIRRSSKDGALWCAVPSRQYKKRDGSTDYWALVRGSGSRELCAWILSAYKEQFPDQAAPAEGGVDDDMPFTVLLPLIGLLGLIA